MKKLRDFFKMIATAVICFAISLVHGKARQVKPVNKAFAGGQAVSDNVVKNAGCQAGGNVLFEYGLNRTGFCRNNRYSLRLKKNFYWMQGPGDRRIRVYAVPDTG